MAVIKFTFLFNWRSRSGWSETFYRDLTSFADLADGNVTRISRNIATKRAGCLTVNAIIQAVRVSNTSTPNIVRVIQLNMPGTLGSFFGDATTNSDVVNVALLSNLVGASGARRSYMLRGLPDADVVNGQVTFARFGQGPYTEWFTELTNGSYRIRDNIKGVPFAVVDITGATGILTTVAPPPWPANQALLIRTRTVGNGKKISWTGKTIATGANTTTLRNWKYGDAQAGISFALTPTYTPITDSVITEPKWARTRKTGRPSDLSRGRVAKRT